ncbi:transglycosylase domain-containing protein [Virgibacillus oceani]|uniref:Penicillin-binding protein 1F n=1 Tax=Virgibacillus oceani TaxID=1479511 RepID=A0A917HD18_9BACI|nr:PBP1A family penicillin-binding protein [Virgibacillus oceani]GGG75053.1 penicillin-binding protein 1F [Virgibacillus oceani]
MDKKKNKFEQLKSIPSKVKWYLLAAAFIIFFGLIGYFIIVFGGNLIVNEEDLILDAKTTIETLDGEVIASLYHENRTPIDINDIPEHVKNAFVAIEDRRYYDHAGVDFKSVTRAVFKDIVAMKKVEGASTITQQVAKNLFLHNDKTWMRKTKEVMAAIYLEREFSKDKILGLYVNGIYFGKGVYGIEAASQLFFSKSAKNLSLSEGAMLAGLAQAPNGYSPIHHPDRALTRRNTVLKAMDAAGMISTEKRVKEQGKTLGLHVKEKTPNPWADSYIDLVMKEAASVHQLSIDELKRGGYRIVVNMNDIAQQIAYEKFKNEDYFPGNTTGVEGAFVMMDQKNGSIIAAIGGRDYSLGDLNRVTVKRQPGSAMKPIAVYGPAMMKDNYQPYTILPDQKMDINGYTATNVDNDYAGAVSIYDALVKSKNAPSVWLLDEIGIPYAKEYLNRMNITIPDNGLAIALGGLSKGLTPLKMMESYRVFAHSGKAVNSHTINRIYDQDGEIMFQNEISETNVFSPQVAWNMTEILQANVDYGTAESGEYEKALAGKTGSTQHPFVDGQYKDAWFVGYTPEFVSALWMGYDRSDKNHYLTAGSKYPTMLTKAILTELDKRKSLASAFTKPENVDALAKPIKLPEQTELSASYTFGGISLVKGKLTWSGSADDRVVYHVYREKEGIDKRIGEVESDNEFIVDDISIFQTEDYYVVPYNPLTKIEGKRSNSVELSF